MQLIDKLKNTFVDSTITIVHKNVKFGFTIHVLKPTKANPYYLIFTTGLSNKGQNVPEKHNEFKYIELYFCLPEYWTPENKSEDNQWPIKWLNKIAEIPQKSNNWFGPGDTIPAGKPPKAISANLAQNNFILTEPMLFDKQLKTVFYNEKAIHFLSVIPIFNKEMDYKHRNSAKVLIEKLQHKNYTELVDEYRTPVVGEFSFKYLWLIIITLLIVAAVVTVIVTDGEWRPFENNTPTTLPHLKNN